MKDVLSENKRKITRVLSLIVMVSGVSVILGWILNIEIFKSIHPALGQMDFPTAVSFILSGTILYFISKAVEGEFDKAQVVLSITSLVFTLFIGILFFSAVFNTRNNIEDLFIKILPSISKTAFPDLPSIPVIFNFILIAIAGIITLLNPKKLKSKLKIMGLVVAVIGALAIIGYILDLPSLYYYKEGRNSAIALTTAVLFVLLGTGLLCL